MTVLLALLGVALVCADDSGKHLSVTLQSLWRHTPLISEASEFVAEKSETLFWQFVEALGVVEARSDEQAFALARAKASALLETSDMPLFDMALGLRYFSPRVEYGRQLFAAALDAADASLELRRRLAQCGAVAHLGRASFVCSPAELERALNDAPSSVAIELYDVDHRYPSAPARAASSSSSSSSLHTVVLYGEIGSAAFVALHTVLAARAAVDVHYVVRHCDARATATSTGAASPMMLGGYGVELNLKSVEYKAENDDNVVAVEGHEGDTLRDAARDDAHSSLFASDGRFEQLKPAEVLALGVQAAQVVAGATRQLNMLREVAQDFPSMAVGLSRVRANRTFVAELEKQKLVAHPGANMLYINGRSFEPQTVSAFDLFDALRAEASKVSALRAAKLAAGTIRQLAALDVAKPTRSVRFRVPLAAALALNDLESEMLYKSWNNKLAAFEKFRPSWGQQWPMIRRNMFTATYIVDPTQGACLYVLAMLQRIVAQRFPVRVTLLFATDMARDPVLAREVARAYLALAADIDHSAPLSAAAANDDDASSADVRPVSWPQRPALLEALQFFAAIAQHQQGYTDLRNNSVISAGLRNIGSMLDHEAAMKGGEHAAHIDEMLARMNAAAQGLRDASATDAVAYVNGVLVSSEDVVNGMLRECMSQIDFLKAQITSKVLSDATPDIYDALLTIRPDGAVFSRPNPLIQTKPRQPARFISLASTAANVALAAAPMLADAAQELEPKPLTHLISIDIGTSNGRQSVLSLLDHLNESANVRFAMIFCRANDAVDVRARLARALMTLRNDDSIRLSLALQALRRLLTATDAQCVEATKSDAALSKLLFDDATKHTSALARAFAATSTVDSRFAAFCRELAQKSPGAGNVDRIVTNGRVIALNDGAAFVDWAYLEAHESRHAGVMTVLDSAEFVGVDPDAQTNAMRSDVAMRVISLLGVESASSSSNTFAPQKSTIALPVHIAAGDKLRCGVLVQAVLDPLSTATQRVTPMLVALASDASFDVCVEVTLNPMQKLTALPLKTFYRASLPTRPRFVEGQIESPSAYFRDLPPERLLTLALDLPAAWLADANAAPVDLDNIRLNQLPDAMTTLSASFALRAVLVEGSCSDLSASGAPPRGLQLMLTQQQTKLINNEQQRQQQQQLASKTVDTIVMSNLGYFQLKASPGVWRLRLLDGVGARLYRIVNDDAALVDAQDDADRGVVVVVNGLQGVGDLNLRVDRRPSSLTSSETLLGAADEDEQADPEEIMMQYQRMYGGAVQQDSERQKARALARTERRQSIALALRNAAENGVINVFSVATGHLYERFMRIMMLSVLRHTKNKVKFWILSNFLSPHWRDFLPAMARHYNFDFEFVTYKWPTWLHKQTEKQRVIWGYKILFLDVLFPLELQRVIYVDADQIVRTDLKELMALDLEGAPYAYTPFCSDRKEMDGFRFWKAGYWQEHLGGKPYHISALYVIDLAVFRRQAAGDQLRATYDSLSKDPNSLANLDQDLPNYLQHQVRIYSLPQHWLWCETWCSDESKPAAKTIDMCNNPLTKTPKLENAMRIASEWNDYDLEIKRLEQQFIANATQKASNNKLHSEL